MEDVANAKEINAMFACYLFPYHLIMNEMLPYHAMSNGWLHWVLSKLYMACSNQINKYSKIKKKQLLTISLQASQLLASARCHTCEGNMRKH